ncbi:MAG: hypothetical protein LBQ35_01510, partial [Spirochaetaceae bacterium]|nr:hypothetical protein [Spirochaetaceae bacterium]
KTFTFPLVHSGKVFFVSFEVKIIQDLVISQRLKANADALARSALRLPAPCLCSMLAGWETASPPRLNPGFQDKEGR